MSSSARGRWVMPAAAAPASVALPAWVLVADTATLYAGIAPLAAACVVAAYRKVVMARRPAVSAWFELSLAAAAVAAIGAAGAALALIRARDGFSVVPVENVPTVSSCLNTCGPRWRDCWCCSALTFSDCTSDSQRHLPAACWPAA